MCREAHLLSHCLCLSLSISVSHSLNLFHSGGTLHVCLFLRFTFLGRLWSALSLTKHVLQILTLRGGLHDTTTYIYRATLHIIFLFMQGTKKAIQSGWVAHISNWREFRDQNEACSVAYSPGCTWLTWGDLKKKIGASPVDQAVGALCS